MRKPNGFVIYDGPSLIDGAPIVAIAVKTKPGKANSKTGAMLQTYILRQDRDPLSANKSGADRSICGNCPHRGRPTRRRDRRTAEDRSCYVFLGQGPLNVWRTWRRGRYGKLEGHAAIAAFGAGMAIRIGTYGDGAAVPAYVWESLISNARMHTAYSHQAELEQAAFRPNLYMRSADSLREAQEAWDRGQRTFRVLRAAERPVAGKEVLCPSLRGVHCIDCGLCGGSAVKAKSIAIPAHGAGAANFA